MVQKDYIVRIIEQLAAFLWTIAFNKKIKNYDFALEKIEEAYNRLLNLDSNKIKNLKVNEIIENYTYKNILNKDNVEIIANLLFEEVDIMEEINGLNKISLEYYQKSFVLFCLLVNEVNIQKYEKINDIINKLKNYEVTNETKYKMYEYYERRVLYGKVEDKLYELKENSCLNIKNEIKAFYKRVLEKDDETLEKGDLPRSEVIEEINKL
jgi:hypothetical protein